LETQFFKYFRIRKPWVPGLLKERKIRIKYLPVLGVSKPSETRQFSQNNQKRTGRFLGGSVPRLLQGFGEPWLYVKNRVFGFLRAVVLHLENRPDTPEGIWVLGAVSNTRVTLNLNTEAGTGWQGVGLGFGVETRNERCSSSTTGVDDRDL